MTSTSSLLRSAALLFVLLFASIYCPNAQAQLPAGSILWLKADSGVTQTNGVISLWKDMSGRGNDARQPIQTAQPAYVAHAANKLPVVRFGGANYMVGASVMPVGADYSLTYVVKINNISAANNVVSGLSHAHYFGGDLYPRMLHNTDFAIQAVSTIPMTTEYNVVTMTFLQGRQRGIIYVNGTFSDSNMIGPNVDSTIELGAFGGGNFLNGDLAEVTLYNRELSDPDRHELEGYLFAKYGITTPQPYSPPAAGAMLWLKADTGVVVTNGLVTRWKDQSGNGYDARQDSTSAQPSYIQNAMFTLPAVRFNGTSNLMRAPSVFPVHSDYSLSFVVRMNNIGYTNNVVSGNTYAHYFGGNGYMKVLHNGNFNYLATSTIPVAQAQFAIVTITYLEARQRAAVYIDSYLADSNFVGPNTDSVIYLGAAGGANFLGGDIAEVLLYRRELSDADRKTSEDYLFHKYGINLPPPPIPDSTFSVVPKAEQLYARESNDSANVRIAGALRLAGCDSLYVSVTRNGLPWKRSSVPLTYLDKLAQFDLTTSIHAELSEYKFTIGAKSRTIDSVLAVRDSVVCGDVYLIDGQSNCIFGGSILKHEFGRTFGVNFSPRAADTAWTVALADGSGGAPDIGAWAMYMQNTLIAETHLPICIINGAVGGTSIESHQRVNTNPTDLTTIYGSLLYRVRKSGLAQKAKAMFWYQGESNSITNYYGNFWSLYGDWRLDYPSVSKFYIVQIRPGCGAANEPLRELLRTLSDSLPNIQPVSVMGIAGHDGCHYAQIGYDSIGAHMARLVMRDFYHATDTVDIVGPNIRKAFYTDSTNSVLAIVFANAKGGLTITPDKTVGGFSEKIKDAFLLDDTLNIVSSVRVSSDTAYLTLLAPHKASFVEYLPQNYPGSAVVYEGPWIKNMVGIGAFSFNHFPVTPAGPTESVSGALQAGMEVSVKPNPFTTNTEVQITLTKPEQLKITLYDPLGREIRQENLNAHAGANQLLIERGGLAAGHYFCKISGRETVKAIPIVIE